MCEKEMEESSSIEVRMTMDGKGKGLFAAKLFKEGDVIFEEQPLVCSQFSWNKAYGYLCCDFCMRPLESAEENARRLTSKCQLVLPFPECCSTKNASIVQCPSCEIKYCSGDCLEKAWNLYHQTLCLKCSTDQGHPLEQLNEAWKQMHYPPETCSIMLLARVIAVVKQSFDKEAATQRFMQFCHQTKNIEEEMAHKLLGEQFASQLKLLQELFSQALYTEEVQHWFTPDGFRSMVALVGTNGQGVGTSPISEWVKNTNSLELTDQERVALDAFIDQLYEDMDQAVGDFLNNEGSALFALQSTCNHSCDPNAMSSFPHNNFQLSMNATRDIAAGEEILISYLDSCALDRSRHSRQKILRENYLFSCCCTKCRVEADEPDETSEDDSDDDEEST